MLVVTRKPGDSINIGDNVVELVERDARAAEVGQ